MSLKPNLKDYFFRTSYAKQFSNKPTGPTHSKLPYQKSQPKREQYSRSRTQIGANTRSYSREVPTTQPDSYREYNISGAQKVQPIYQRVENYPSNQINSDDNYMSITKRDFQNPWENPDFERNPIPKVRGKAPHLVTSKDNLLAQLIKSHDNMNAQTEPAETFQEFNRDLFGQRIDTQNSHPEFYAPPVDYHNRFNNTDRTHNQGDSTNRSSKYYGSNSREFNSRSESRLARAPEDTFRFKNPESPRSHTYIGNSNASTHRISPRPIVEGGVPNTLYVPRSYEFQKLPLYSEELKNENIRRYKRSPSRRRLDNEFEMSIGNSSLNDSIYSKMNRSYTPTRTILQESLSNQELEARAELFKNSRNKTLRDPAQQSIYSELAENSNLKQDFLRTREDNNLKEAATDNFHPYRNRNADKSEDRNIRSQSQDRVPEFNREPYTKFENRENVEETRGRSRSEIKRTEDIQRLNFPFSSSYNPTKSLQPEDKNYLKSREESSGNFERSQEFSNLSGYVPSTLRMPDEPAKNSKHARDDQKVSQNFERNRSETNFNKSFEEIDRILERKGSPRQQPSHSLSRQDEQLNLSSSYSGSHLQSRRREDNLMSKTEKKAVRAPALPSEEKRPSTPVIHVIQERSKPIREHSKEQVKIVTRRKADDISDVNNKTIDDLENSQIPEKYYKYIVKRDSQENNSSQIIVDSSKPQGRYPRNPIPVKESKNIYRGTSENRSRTVYTEEYQETGFTNDSFSEIPSAPIRKTSSEVEAETEYEEETQVQNNNIIDFNGTLDPFNKIKGIEKLTPEKLPIIEESAYTSSSQVLSEELTPMQKDSYTGMESEKSVSNNSENQTKLNKSGRPSAQSSNIEFLKPDTLSQDKIPSMFTTLENKSPVIPEDIEYKSSDAVLTHRSNNSEGLSQEDGQQRSKYDSNAPNGEKQERKSLTPKKDRLKNLFKKERSSVNTRSEAVPLYSENKSESRDSIRKDQLIQPPEVPQRDPEETHREIERLKSQLAGLEEEIKAQQQIKNTFQEQNNTFLNEKRLSLPLEKQNQNYSSSAHSTFDPSVYANKRLSSPNFGRKDQADEEIYSSNNSVKVQVNEKIPRLSLSTQKDKKYSVVNPDYSNQKEINLNINLHDNSNNLTPRRNDDIEKSNIGITDRETIISMPASESRNLPIYSQEKQRNRIFEESASKPATYKNVEFFEIRTIYEDDYKFFLLDDFINKEIPLNKLNLPNQKNKQGKYFESDL